jgi:hypothetical protein
MTLKRKDSEIFLVEEERYAKKSKKSKQSVFQLAFQKQGLKQMYRTMREVDNSCTTLTKDERR